MNAFTSLDALDLGIDHFDRPLVPTAERLGIAAAIAAVLFVVWIGAEHESRGAVLGAGNAMQSHAVQITLPKVHVVGQRAG